MAQRDRHTELAIPQQSSIVSYVRALDWEITDNMLQSQWIEWIEWIVAVRHRYDTY